MSIAGAAFHARAAKRSQLASPVLQDRRGPFLWHFLQRVPFPFGYIALVFFGLLATLFWEM